RINAARKALGDNGVAQKLIRTIARKGLRFVGEVQPASNGDRPVPTGDEPHESSRALPLPDRPAIAVLPFVNMSGDPEQEYFSDGISEDIITDLSKISGLFVIARNTVFAYKGKTVDVQEVAKRLKVNFILEGSVRKAGS